VEVTCSTLNPMEVRLAAGMVGGPPEVPYAPGVEGVGRAIEGPHEGELVRFECALPGHGSNGALAEFALAEPESIHPLPDGTSPDLAAALGVVGVTAALALDAAAPVEGARVAVLGASGSVGKQAVQLARNRGAARVVAAARDRDALERARELGADAVVELQDGDSREAIAEALVEAAEGRLDVVVDPLWGVPGAAAASSVAHGGRVVNVGHSAGPNEPPPWHELRINAASMIGVSSGWTDMERKRPVYAELLDAALAGELEVDREVVRLADISSAWERQQGSPHQKIVIDVGGGE
ncbi:MAG TPA: zinc-binding alcohol dehydrogenase family protein, partial [Solirubrobacterales bacterium]|nr:zinc-binding alcohol dehydrogenase family protein [Solirubrobacterales bacterium]